MRLSHLLLAVSLVYSSAHAATLSATNTVYADDVSLDTPFTLRTATQVPGQTLKPGDYIMTIKDHLTDRAIIQVSTGDRKVIATFLAALHSGLHGASSPGPIPLAIDKGHDVLRGFTFPGGGTVEFVYPKAEAAELVNKTSEAVLAIDPASDNLRSTGTTLSREDSQIVTLWSLQATRLSPTQNGIAAKKFTPQPSVDTSTVVAQAQSPTQPVASSSASSSNQVSAKRAAPAGTATVAVNRIPAVKALPKTASNMPLLLLSVVGSFVAAMSLHALRFSKDEL